MKLFFSKSRHFICRLEEAILKRERYLENIKYLQYVQNLIRHPSICSLPLPYDSFRTIEEVRGIDFVLVASRYVVIVTVFA